MHGQVSANDQVKLVGHYTNMVISQNDDPHFLSGYNVDLYTRNGVALANLGVAVGSQEPVWATIQEVVYEPRTTKLRFRAEYSSGWETSKKTGPQGRAARAVITFSGRVKMGKAVGTITRQDAYCDDCEPEHERITLEKTGDMSIYLHQ